MLKTYGEIPENIKINETEASAAMQEEEDEEGVNVEFNIDEI